MTPAAGVDSWPANSRSPSLCNALEEGDPATCTGATRRRPSLVRLSFWRAAVLEGRCEGAAALTLSGALKVGGGGRCTVGSFVLFDLPSAAALGGPSLTSGESWMAASRARCSALSKSFDACRMPGASPYKVASSSSTCCWGTGMPSSDSSIVNTAIEPSMLAATKVYPSGVHARSFTAASNMDFIIMTGCAWVVFHTLSCLSWDPRAMQWLAETSALALLPFSEAAGFCMKNFGLVAHTTTGALCPTSL
mmetsp:Transcript_3647/g.10487  ORF Transcript_3647/g.10487 Transcript_3647/m.10487 type:complete len:250 (+) Transcript_3647:1476-2225(+)